MKSQGVLIVHLSCWSLLTYWSLQLGEAFSRPLSFSYSPGA